MRMGVIFWVLMLLWMVFGIFGMWWPGLGPYQWYGHGLFLFVLFVLLGWKCFGPPVQNG